MDWVGVAWPQWVWNGFSWFVYDSEGLECPLWVWHGLSCMSWLQCVWRGSMGVACPQWVWHDSAEEGFTVNFSQS